MQIKTISEAKAHLSKLVVKALQGEEVIISVAGKPVVKLITIWNQPLKSLAWVISADISG